MWTAFLGEPLIGRFSPLLWQSYVMSGYDSTSSECREISLAGLTPHSTGAPARPPSEGGGGGAARDGRGWLRRVTANSVALRQLGSGAGHLARARITRDTGAAVIGDG